MVSLLLLGDHGTTFGGNPLDCAVASSVFQRINTPEFLENVRKNGGHFREQLESLSSPLIKDIRSKGLILGLELKVDPAPLVGMAQERGLLIITAANNTIRFVPPLNISKAEIDQVIDKPQALNISAISSIAKSSIRSFVKSFWNLDT